MVERISDNVTIERQNRFVVITRYGGPFRCGQVVYLTPDDRERLQEYLNREYPVPVGKHFPDSPNPS